MRGRPLVRQLPPVEYLRECFTLDSLSVVRWRRRPLNHFASKQVCNRVNGRQTGKVAGRRLSSGHRTIRLDGIDYMYHTIRKALL